MSAHHCILHFVSFSFASLFRSENCQGNATSQDFMVKTKIYNENVYQNLEEPRPTWPDDPSKQAPKGFYDKFDWECLHRPMAEVISRMAKPTQYKLVYAKVGTITKSNIDLFTSQST